MNSDDPTAVLERALSAARVILFQQDAQRRYQWVSRSFMGQRQQDVFGKREEDFLPEPLASRAIAEKQLALVTGEPRSWTTEVSEDGVLRIMQVRVEPTRDAAGVINGLIGGAIDVTTDKQAEDTVRASERMLREVLDNLFAFVGVLDTQGRMIEANRAPLEAAGIERADVIGRYF
ncbi:MAG: PAS domain-containing protein [Beijerinckiaceae bacterium]|nr:PAS domain-containing protein [Beijerinckiaceae bacterium]MBX9760601.1 PAS domain-containing protein [Beijerinckiaceae bacterium]